MAEEVMVCDRCKGNGKVECSELVDYHKGDYNYWWEKCIRCDGTGRLVKTTTVSYKPFKEKG